MPKQYLYEFIPPVTIYGGIKSEDSFLDNLVDQVKKDLEELKDQNMKSYADEFMRKALLAANNVPSNTPAVIAKYALEKNEDYLYREALKASIVDSKINNGMLTLISSHINRRFSEDADALVWDKWYGFFCLN